MSEPLQLVDSLIYRLTDSDGVNTDEINVTMWGGSRDMNKRAEGALRVLACVNACAHISTESLESGLQQNLLMRARIAEEQRDEMLDALKDVMEWINNWSPEFTYDPEWEASSDAARAAIAKVEVTP